MPSPSNVLSGTGGSASTSVAVTGRTSVLCSSTTRRPQEFPPVALPSRPTTHKRAIADGRDKPEMQRGAELPAGAKTEAPIGLYNKKAAQYKPCSFFSSYKKLDYAAASLLSS